MGRTRSFSPTGVAAPDASNPAGIAERDKWYAVTVKPRHDRTVSTILQAKGYETFLPTYKKRYTYPARVKETELPLFPGYVFCRLDVSSRLPLLTTPGVLNILGIGRIPVAVDDREIASLQNAIQARVPAYPFPFLKAGRKVQITEGPLSGVEGIVLRYRQSFRLVLSITLLQRSVVLEIDRVCVRPQALSAAKALTDLEEVACGG